MQVETVATREVASTCAIEVAIGLGWLLDQVDGLRTTFNTRRESGVTWEASAGADMKVLAVKMGWCGFV